MATALSEIRSCVLAGHNRMVLGQAGTGKSVLLKSLRMAMEEKKKKVITCATTCMADSNIGGIS